MSTQSTRTTAELGGLARLSADALLGVTDVVEAMHQAIATGGGLLGSARSGRTRGVTGLVYRNVRRATGLAGVGLDRLLANRLATTLANRFGPSKGGEPSPRRAALLGVLNGLVGDHLVATDNPLAIPMQLRRQGRPLSPDAFSDPNSKSAGRVLVLVHGSCMNDLQWQRHQHDHGESLARDLGFTPVYLRYNTGLHISQNGRSLAELLQQLVDTASLPLHLTLLAHSMGGLVSRSACQVAQLSGHTWLKQVAKMVFLGTPHHGAPLEKGGNWLNALLDISPYSAPFARLGRIRSAGITDLRYGNIVDQDWQGQDRFQLAGDRRTPAPLPDGIDCYSIAGSLGSRRRRIGDHLLGDGLVPVPSALGRHSNPDYDLAFPTGHTALMPDVGHLGLLHHPEVYRTLRGWLQS